MIEDEGWAIEVLRERSGRYQGEMGKKSVVPHQATERRGLKSVEILIELGEGFVAPVWTYGEWLVGRIARNLGARAPNAKGRSEDRSALWRFKL